MIPDGGTGRPMRGERGASMPRIGRVATERGEGGHDLEFTRRRAAAARLVHTQQVTGASPVGATKSRCAVIGVPNAARASLPSPPPRRRRTPTVRPHTRRRTIPPLAADHVAVSGTLSPRRRISRRAPGRALRTCGGRGLSISLRSKLAGNPAQDFTKSFAPKAPLMIGDVDAVAVEHEIAGTALIVTLPRHAQNAPPPDQPRAPLASSGPTAARRDVTQQFFNDPKKPPAMASGTRGGGR